MNTQTAMKLDTPDLCQEQRRLLQAWLKIIKRNAAKREVDQRIGFLQWCKKTAQQELTPANFAYFEKQWVTAMEKAHIALERHIAAVRCQNGL